MNGVEIASWTLIGTAAGFILTALQVLFEKGPDQKSEE